MVEIHAKEKLGAAPDMTLDLQSEFWTVGANICSIFLHFLFVFPIFVCVWYAFTTATGLFTFLLAKLILLDQAFFSSALSCTGIRQEWEARRNIGDSGQIVY